jgi:TonB family protein
MISLVAGDAGGNRTPSPILGHAGEPGESPKAPTAPAQKADIASPEQIPTKEPAPVPSLPREDVTPVKKPEAKPEPKPELKPEPKPEPKPDPKPEPKKVEPPKDTKSGKPPEDPVKAALEQARRKASSRAESGDRGNAVEQALAQARRNASGNRGGGGGEGDGPGGGGLGDVYMGQVMLAVRPNWGFASAARVNLSCVIRVNVDMQGTVLLAQISQGSGNAQFDASAVNAVVRTGQSGQFPPPPSREYANLDLVFTLDELMGR